MGAVKALIVIFLVLVTIMHFFPDQFEEGKQWTLEKTQSLINDNTSLDLDFVDEPEEELEEEEEDGSSLIPY